MILNSILEISPKSGSSSGQDLTKVIVNLAKEFQEMMPKEYDIEKVSQKYKNNYYESMNTVLL